MKGFIRITTTEGELFVLNIYQIVKLEPHPSTEKGHKTTVYMSDGSVIEANLPLQYFVEIIDNNLNPLSKIEKK